MIAIEGKLEDFDEGFTAKDIPASNWAVFNCIGSMPGSIQRVWERIYHEWFPTSGYERVRTPELEVYPPGDLNSEDYRCEVWIPFIHKAKVCVFGSVL